MFAGGVAMSIRSPATKGTLPVATAEVPPLGIVQINEVGAPFLCTVKVKSAGAVTFMKQPSAVNVRECPARC
jgi:hypothetical protein